MNAYAYLETSHCGHDELVEKADASRRRLMKFIEREIEKLVRKAGAA